MFNVGKVNLEKPLLLAPMEDVTDLGYRKLCKELGADIVYTEFVNSDGLIRCNKKTEKKLIITDEERPVGIQIYGGNLQPMIDAAKIAEQKNPEIIDINAGCWVKKIATRGAGAGLMKDPEYLQTMVAEIVKSVSLPVTVKTRIGWDEKNINILEIAKRMEDVGVKALTVHCRTRSMGHSGSPDWSWIPKVKEVVKIPVVLNGGVMEAQDVINAYKETDADGIMIARGAIDHPWIFREAKELMQFGEVRSVLTPLERVETALRHLKYEMAIKENIRHAIIPFRKYYSGYLKGLYNASRVRQVLVRLEEYTEIEDTLYSYLKELEREHKEDGHFLDKNKSEE